VNGGSSSDDIFQIVREGVSISRHDVGWRNLTMVTIWDIGLLLGAVIAASPHRREPAMAIRSSCFVG
jgi:hypothetical protein